MSALRGKQAELKAVMDKLASLDADLQVGVIKNRFVRCVYRLHAGVLGQATNCSANSHIVTAGAYAQELSQYCDCGVCT